MVEVIDAALLRKMWLRGDYVGDIARHFGVTTSCVYIARKRHDIPDREPLPRQRRYSSYREPRPGTRIYIHNEEPRR